MNILYGVPGEGMGHATRSKVVIEHLLKKHNVHVVSSSRAFSFLNKAFPERVHEIKGFHFAFDEARISKSGTFWLNLKNAPKNLQHNIRSYYDLDRQFHPDLVITDFESFSYLYAKRHNLPVISIDNIQLMDRCKVDVKIDADQKENAQLAKAIVRAKVPGCNHYLITSFLDAEINKKNTKLVKPIIRNEIVHAKTSVGNHIVVYQTNTNLNVLLPVLNSLKNLEFRVYGSKVNERHDNVVLKTFSEDEFICDFASAAAVLANGGYSFISEAVYLKKPIFSVPLEDQFEQYLNAVCIEKAGFGRYQPQLTTDGLKAFLYDLDYFRNQLAHYEQKGNELLFNQLDALLDSYS